MVFRWNLKYLGIINMLDLTMWSVWTLLCPLYYKILYVYPCASRTCRYRQGDKLTLSRYYSWGFYALSDDDHQNADEILKLLINPYVLVVQDRASSFAQILLPMSKTCEKNCSVSSAISHRGWSFDLTRLTIKYIEGHELFLVSSAYTG